MKKILILIISFIILIKLNYTNAQIPINVPVSGLQAWYPLNGNANDLSGNGKNGTLAGLILPSPTTDRYGITNSAYSFVGVNATYSSDGSHIILPDFDFNVWNEFTISLWVYENSTFVREGLIAFGYTVPNSSDQPCFRITRDNMYNAIIAIVSDSLILYQDNFSFRNKWKHYCMTYNSTSMNFYIDGVLVNSKSSDVLPVIPKGFNAIARQSWNNGTSTSTRFTGKIDDVGIWSRVLSQNEITNLIEGSITTAPENNFSNEFCLFPNPANDIINLKCNSFEKFEKYQIIDQFGRNIESGTITNENTKIDISQLSSGVYNIICIGKTFSTINFIKHQ